MSDSPFIANVTEATFEAEVIQRSMNTLVIVDFWAAWCNPCKMLMPMLAAITEKYNGTVFLAKIDTDNERSLAEQFAIRSIPSVKLFKQGEQIDEFNGVIPESSIIQLIENHKFHESDFELQKVNDAFLTSDFETADKILTPILEKDASNKKANILAAKIALKKGDYTKVDALLVHLPINLIDDPEIKEIHALNNFAKEIEHAPPLKELEEKLSTQDNFELRYQLACHMALQGNYEKALDNFLLVLQQNRQYKEDGARKSMLAIFDLLGGSGPLVNIFRIKMARAIN